jgi:hypothetical protein
MAAADKGVKNMKGTRCYGDFYILAKKGYYTTVPKNI